MLGTSMDYESEESRAKGCWDPATMLSPFLEKWSSPVADFVVDDVWCGMVGSVGFGDHGTPEKSAFWTKTLQEVYQGDEGRKKAKMALLNLLTRDGLLLRLRDVKCPVHWLQVCASLSLCLRARLDNSDLQASIVEPNILLQCAGHQGHPLWHYRAC